MTTAERAEVELANRQGRLHPSQRGQVLDGTFWLAAVLAAAGLVTAVALPVTSLETRFGAGLAAASLVAALGPAVPILALACWLAFVCGRRLADVREGRLVAITGWTHDFGRQRPDRAYPIVLRTRLSKGLNEQYFLVAGGKEFRLYRLSGLRERIQAERNNTVYLTPRSKLLINVLPA
ncbi:hypothetical protein [Amycolatopsis australiensis]|uniref:Uncharacterized protein n=1 Tax=Amycolatopsis australiensis TaxID=546364 RepID=A0A1K1RQT5_9PSEU|nr:hypothetical protein [Amycolatopsis australiensis]SFW74250.1 hypothetical protein SAMN04489730_3734 [Amycolatopsis australiensis]